MAQLRSIDWLLNQVPESPDVVLSYIHDHPELSSKQDVHGYSLLHAATSYNHLTLLRSLVNDLHLDPNIKDEDGETCLFNAESVEIATELIALGVDSETPNNEGQTAAEKLDDEDEQPEVAAYLKTLRSGSQTEIVPTNMEPTELDNTSATDAVHPPPPLPNGIHVDIGTMPESEVGGDPDPEFRRRIEELAAREDFDGSEGQRELRDLVSDAVSGLSHENQGPATRRRLG